MSARAIAAPPTTPTIHQMYEIGSSGNGVGTGTVVTIGGSLTEESDLKNAGSRELLSAVALPEKKAGLISL